MSDIYVSYETYLSENDLFSLFKLLGLLSFDRHAPTSFKLIFALFSVRFYSVYKVLLQYAFFYHATYFLSQQDSFLPVSIFIYYILIYAYIKADINAHITQSAIFKVLQYYKFYINDSTTL